MSIYRSAVSPTSVQCHSVVCNGTPKAALSQHAPNKAQSPRLSTASPVYRAGRKRAPQWSKVSQAELVDLTRENMAIFFKACDPDAQEHAISFLVRLLEARPTDVIPYLRLDFVRFFCGTLRRNLTNQTFVYTTCRFISVLAGNSPKHCIVMSQSIDVQLCEDLLRYHLEGSQSIHKAIIEAFTPLLNASEPHRSALLEPMSRGIEWVFAYLRRWKISEEMQYVMLEYFRTLVEDEEELKLEVVRRGLLVDITDAFESFPSSYRLRYLVIDLLTTLTERSGETRRQSIQEGHLSHILETLKLLQRTPEMVLLITQAIQIYGADLDTRNLMGRTGFVRELLQILRNMVEPSQELYAASHRKNLCQVLTTLQGVVYRSEINRDALMDLRELKLIKEIVQRYIFDENVVEAAFKLLETLCSDCYRDERPPRFVQEATKRGALEDIIQFSTLILSENKGKARYAELACSVLLHICLIGCQEIVFGTSPHLCRLIPEAIEACFENEIVLNAALSLICYTKP